MLSSLKRAALALGVIGVFVTPAILASPAAAKSVPFHVVTVRTAPVKQRTTAPKYVFRTDGSWSTVYDGVEFGWTTDHLWVIASYATLLSHSTDAIADAMCDDIGMGVLCSWPVEQITDALIKGQARLTKNGVWLAIYPRSYWNPSITGGRY